MTGVEYLNRRDLHPLWDGVRDPLREDVADAYEQGKADGYNEGFEAGRDNTIKEVCEWLEQNAYLYCDDIDTLHESALIGDFRYAMKVVHEIN